MAKLIIEKGKNKEILKFIYLKFSEILINKNNFYENP